MNGVRENLKEVLVLDAGDLLFKKFFNPLSEDELKVITQKATLIIDSFNLMGYDAVGVGDDDLSLGKEFLLETAKRANFPLISSNLVDEESGKLLFQPYLLKEINGLKIGIFSLLSPDLFLGPADLRKKGLIFKPSVESAQTMVRELQPKTDLIILLSHLGYQKDMELAQTVSGIHLIVGSHSGIQLSYPPVINNTILLHTSPKGMYAGKLDLTFYNKELSFYNTLTKRSMESNLNFLENRLNSPQLSEAEKAQLRKGKEETKRSLQQFQGKNEFTNTLFPLSEQMKEHPDIMLLIGTFKLNSPEIAKPLPPK